MPRLEVTKEPVKKGRRVLGNIYRWPDGKSCYLARRRSDQIIRHGKGKSISAAIREEVACWGIEQDILFRLRGLGIRYVGVICEDTGDRWLTPIARFFNPQYAGTFRYSPGSAALFKTLPLRFFKARPGSRARL